MQLTFPEEPLSVDEFAALPEEEGWRLELTRGRLVREPAPGPRHGCLALRVARALDDFVEERGLGLVFVDTAFTLSAGEGIVRVPDAAFVSSDRIPLEGVSDRFWELAPDLAVEVGSSSNRASELQRKALEYLDSGARLVWVADPVERTVAVYRARSEIRILVAGEDLEGDEVLSGLRLAIEDLFA